MSTEKDFPENSPRLRVSPSPRRPISFARWQQIEAILQATLDRAPQERAAFLQEVCAGDIELQSEARSLVDAHDAAADFIEEPALARDAHVLLSDLPSNIGREIGPYRVTERLGGGGMGEVYLALDARLNRPVALKILPAYFVSDEQRLRRFQTEARAASALNHPNILTIYEVGEYAGLHFIATEFIAGETIRELVTAETLSRAEILDVISQLMSGLAAAHDAGIVHRDIKPENIMRRSDGIVKILDFGIAKLTEQTAVPDLMPAAAGSKAQTEIGVVMGTVGYMSPEQARGLTVDARTDIWSAGIVLYEMLTGQTPFAGATRLDTMVAILERDPAPLSGGDTELARIVDKALKKDAAERYQTATEMLSHLRQAGPELKNSHEAARVSTRAGADPTLVQWPRYRVAILTVALVLITLFVGTVLYKRFGLHPAKSIPPSAEVRKRYAEMNSTEQLAFVDAQEQRISAMMGDRPVKLNEEALLSIKKEVDRLAAMKASTPDKPGGVGLRAMYARAVPYVPLIVRSFAARKIPIVVGIYLPMIESAYRPCSPSSIGANGLFQLTPGTARGYGVEPAEMCNAEKMTPAAAHYIADRMAELGDDSQSMTLVLLSYNRGPEWVRDTLRQLRNDANYERNFWTLFANRDKLPGLNVESVGYVPRFFAAAIIGENPQTFDLSIPPLSTLNGGSGN